MIDGFDFVFADTSADQIIKGLDTEKPISAAFFTMKEADTRGLWSELPEEMRTSPVSCKESRHMSMHLKNGANNGNNKRQIPQKV